ncbi:MAG: response regulator [Acidobacteria bacterium]|nr:response regulator [Acidobacteriota bacterium]
MLVAGGGDGFRRQLAALLDTQGYGVEAVTDASAALSALVMHAPDAVVLGDAPPAFDAVDVCRRLRAHAGSRRTPVAVLAPSSVPAEAAVQLDADLLPSDATPAQVANWVTTRVPAETTPFDRLRLTLARTADDASTAARPGGATAAADWPLLFQHAGDGAALVDGDGRVLLASDRFAVELGQPSAADCVGRDLLSLLPSAPAAGHADTRPPTLTVTATRDGEVVPIDMEFTPAGHGPSAPVFVTLRNQRWRRVATDALGANHDLAEQLRRSQKIGALGRLAGGVAHDFNNLLQVIAGYAETLGAEGLDHPSRRRLLQRIQRATDRAASLTRQLLAFGRRQVLVPQVLDLNVTVLSLEHMLGRVIGEDVQFVSSLAPDLMRVKVDPGQIEQVLLNLAINARDAMVEGGTLEVATANFLLSDPWSHASLPVSVPGGDWVLLSVLDTGTGMDPETAAQAFEPFFTTKDASRGSGLGLSMVYGIVKQSGGFTWIETAPGAGTSVHVLLPAVHDDDVVAARDDGSASSRIESAGGTVLLVEDDPEVRTIFTTFLKDGGYVVLEAGDGREALEIFERHAAAIDVVVTDVVMPNVSGPSLVSALRARNPGVRVLFVSGYTDQLELDGQDPYAAHVTKPVTRSALLKHVAALIGQSAS